MCSDKEAAMYLHINKIAFPSGQEELLAFLTFTKAFDLYGAIYNAIEEYGQKTGSNFGGMDYIEYFLTIKDVPEEICAKHGFRLFNDYSYSFMRVQ